MGTIYFVPYAASAPGDIIRYDLTQAKDIKVEDGKLMFHLNGKYYLLGQGRWHESRRDALYVVRDYVADLAHMTQMRLQNVEKELEECC